MRNTALLIWLITCMAISANALQFDVGASQWNRIALSENTLAAAPGMELYGETPIARRVSMRLSAYGGIWFGTIAGGEISGLYEWRHKTWMPMAGAGIYAAYEDLLFHTTDSYSYIPPDSFGVGIMLHVKPFRWKTTHTKLSLGGFSIGTDFEHFFTVINYDIRILEISLSFGGSR